MKRQPCAYKDCGLRRPHYMLQDEIRGQQEVEVDDDHVGPVYCSMTCMMLDGKLRAWVDPQEPEDVKNVTGR